MVKRMLLIVKYKDTENVEREIIVSEENVMVVEDQLYIRDKQLSKQEWEEISISSGEKNRENGTEKVGGILILPQLPKNMILNINFLNILLYNIILCYTFN